MCESISGYLPPSTQQTTTHTPLPAIPPPNKTQTKNTQTSFQKDPQQRASAAQLLAHPWLPPPPQPKAKKTKEEGTAAAAATTTGPIPSSPVVSSSETLSTATIGGPPPPPASSSSSLTVDGRGQSVAVAVSGPPPPRSPPVVERGKEEAAGVGVQVQRGGGLWRTLFLRGMSMCFFGYVCVCVYVCMYV
jgi:serine/threonine protein kinase